MSSPELRQRTNATKPADASNSPVKPDARKATPTSSSWSILEILRILFALILLAGGLSWIITGESVIFNWRKLPTLLGQAKRYLQGPISLTPEQLALYNGTDPSLPIYVALNGSIYDVSASPQTYGPGGGYAFFSGRDATRAFLTGCFKEDLTPDLRGVEEMYIPIDAPEDIEGLSKGELKMRKERDVRLAKKQMAGTIAHWATVFRGETGRPYFYVGEVKQEEGWLERLPKRELCDAAREGRPKRKDVEKTEGGKVEYKRGTARPSGS